MSISEQILHPGVVEPAATTPAPPPVLTVAPPLPAVAPDGAPDVALPIPVAVEPLPVVAEPTPPVLDEATPAATTTGAVVEACTSAVSTTWNWTKCAGRVLNGVRTLLFFAVTGALALGSLLAEVDLSGVLSRFTGLPVSPEGIIAFMSVSGIVLRFLTTTQVFVRWRKAAQGGIQKDASAGVDDPEDTDTQ